MNKTLLLLLTIACTLSVHAAGYETMVNIKKQTYEWNDVTNYTGDNGMSWQAVGAMDSKTGGYNALTLHSSVANNGLSGNLTATQTEEGVGTVTFFVKGMQAGTGYGNRTFRVTAGTKYVDAVVNVPSMTGSHQCSAKIDATGASTLSITMLESVSGETAAFCIYNIQWTSFNGKTDTPTFDTDAQFVATNGDTTYYSENSITVNLRSTTEGATLYYTIDGTEPTISSTQASNVELAPGTHTIKAIAWTEALGASEMATKIYKVEKAKLVQYDASNTDAEGDYTITKNSTLTYKTLSGLPFYAINISHPNIITDPIVQPIGLSCYAKNNNNRTLTIAWQAGSIIEEDKILFFEPSTDWMDIKTISDFDAYAMKRFEVEVPTNAQKQVVRFRLKSSGTSIYLDDIITIAADITPLPTPTLSIESGEVASGTTVTITGETSATLHYSINGGEEQTATSPVELTINETTILRAYATKEGWANSNTAQATYTIAGDPTAIDTNTIQEVTTHKILRNGQLYLIHKGTMYDARGVRIY